MAGDWPEDQVLAHSLGLPAAVTLALSPISTDGGGGFYPLPPALERARPKRRAEFAAGRQAARLALQAAGLKGAESPGIGADHLPIWPEGWRGSISHSTRLAGALVARVDAIRFLGLDIEGVMAPELAQEIAPEIMPEAPLTGEDAAFLLTRVFSAKEALFKALYPVVGEVKEFSAAKADWQGEDLRLVLTEPWGPVPEGTSFDVAQSCAAGHVITAIWRFWGGLAGA